MCHTLQDNRIEYVTIAMYMMLTCVFGLILMKWKKPHKLFAQKLHVTLGFNALDSKMFLLLQENNYSSITASSFQTYTEDPNIWHMNHKVSDQNVFPNPDWATDLRTLTSLNVKYKPM